MLMLWTSTRCGSISCAPMQPMFSLIQPNAHTHTKETERAQTEWKLAWKLLEQATHQQQKSGRHPEGGYAIEDWDWIIGRLSTEPCGSPEGHFLKMTDSQDDSNPITAQISQTYNSLLFCNHASWETLTSIGSLCILFKIWNWGNHKC